MSRFESSLGFAVIDVTEDWSAERVSYQAFQLVCLVCCILLCSIKDIQLAGSKARTKRFWRNFSQLPVCNERDTFHTRQTLRHSQYTNWPNTSLSGDVTTRLRKRWRTPLSFLNALCLARMTTTSYRVRGVRQEPGSQYQKVLNKIVS